MGVSGTQYQLDFDGQRHLHAPTPLSGRLQALTSDLRELPVWSRSYRQSLNDLIAIEDTKLTYRERTLLIEALFVAAEDLLEISRREAT